MRTIIPAALTLFALAGTSFAQGANFAYPLSGDTLVAGSSIQVRIDRPVSIYSYVYDLRFL